MKKPLKIAGVMRCCAENLRQYQENGGNEDEGTKLRCPHCKDHLIVSNGCWKWSPDTSDVNS